MQTGRPRKSASSVRISKSRPCIDLSPIFRYCRPGRPDGRLRGESLHLPSIPPIDLRRHATRSTSETDCTAGRKRLKSHELRFRKHTGRSQSTLYDGQYRRQNLLRRLALPRNPSPDYYVTWLCIKSNALMRTPYLEGRRLTLLLSPSRHSTSPPTGAVRKG